MSAILFVCILTGIIHFTEAVATGLRLAGVRTRRIAISLSFVNVSLLVTRTSNMIQAPILGGLVDTAILRGTVPELGMAFRGVLLGAFVGNLCAAFALPTFIRLFSQAVEDFGKLGSVPRVLLKALSPSGIRSIIASAKMPRWSMISRRRLGTLPKTFLVLNMLMVSIYAIGVLASLYAGAQIPEFRATAIQLSAIVNGIATILLAVMVDPGAAKVTDEAVSGKRSEEDVVSMVFYIIIGRVLATLLLAQLLFVPATEYIKGATWILRSLLGG